MIVFCISFVITLKKRGNVHASKEHLVHLSPGN
jgi:hypothetical protein